MKRYKLVHGGPEYQSQMLVRPDGKYVLLADAQAAIAEAKARGYARGVEDAARELDRLADATPWGHENRQRGASTYNWLRAHAFAIRAWAERTKNDAPATGHASTAVAE